MALRRTSTIDACEGWCGLWGEKTSRKTSKEPQADLEQKSGVVVSAGNIHCKRMPLFKERQE